MLQTVESQLRLIVDEDLQRLWYKCEWKAPTERNCTYVSHEFLACNPDFLRQCCAEHHDLLVVWRHLEDFLNISAHVWMYDVEKCEMQVAIEAIVRKNAGEERAGTRKMTGPGTNRKRLFVLSFRYRQLLPDRWFRYRRSSTIFRTILPWASSTTIVPIPGPCKGSLDRS